MGLGFNSITSIPFEGSLRAVIRVALTPSAEQLTSTLNHPVTMAGKYAQLTYPYSNDESADIIAQQTCVCRFIRGIKE